jgi:hypothetical protein
VNLPADFCIRSGKENGMKANIGSLDRGLRIAGAALLAALVVAGVVEDLLAWIFGIIAAMLLITGLTKYCPLYVPLHISTQKHTQGS